MEEKFGQQPEYQQQNSPEAGAGPLGLPPPNPLEIDRRRARPDNEAFTQRRTNSNEHADPKQKGRVTKPIRGKKIEWSNPRSAVFDCAIPKIIISPYDIPRLFEPEDMQRAEVQQEIQRLEQKWLEDLETKDRPALERELRRWEERRENFPSLRKEMQTPEKLQKLEWQIEVIREHLRQRE